MLQLTQRGKMEHKCLWTGLSLTEWGILSIVNAIQIFWLISPLNIAGNSMTVAGDRRNGVGFIENYWGTFLHKMWRRKYRYRTSVIPINLRVLSKAKKVRYRWPCSSKENLEMLENPMLEKMRHQPLYFVIIKSYLNRFLYLKILPYLCYCRHSIFHTKML